MKQSGNYITGNFQQVNNISKDWAQVFVHTDTFERDDKFEEYVAATRDVAGLFTDLCDGKVACVRFADQADAMVFRLRYDNLCQNY